MAYDLSIKEQRVELIKEIKSDENEYRKRVSMREFDVYSDRLHDYVLTYLRKYNSEKTVAETPVISVINIARRIVNQIASLYKHPPKRTFYNVTDKQKQTLEAIYADGMLDSKLLKSNRRYALQGQNLLQVLPLDGKYQVRALMMHNFDAIPNENDPEIADAYLVSAFDKSSYRSEIGYGIDQKLMWDMVNKKIADLDDQKSINERYVVWSKDYNFVMNGLGDILSEEGENPIAPVLPFVDVAQEKDNEFFIRRGPFFADFSIQYNALISEVANVSRLQGFGQGVLKGDMNLLKMIASQRVGPNYVLTLPVDPNNPVESDFSFVTPNADVAGSIGFLEFVLANFLTSRGIDPKMIAGKLQSTQYASGAERLLALIELAEASTEDKIVYQNAEQRIFDIIRSYNNAGIAGIDDKYKMPPLSPDAYVAVEYQKPMVEQSDSERLNLIQQKLELGLMSRREAIIDLRGVDEETADKIMADIDSPQSASGDTDEQE